MSGHGLGPSEVTLVVIAKAPVAGRVKTRLCPPCTHEEAAEIALAALSDTLRTVASVPAARHVLVLDGDVGAWMAEPYEVVPQCDGGLDRRLAAAFEHVGGPALLVGMDTPHLRRSSLEHAIGLLSSPGVDAVLGPADDGGFWTIGLRSSRPELFHGVPMSDPDTGAEQLRRLTHWGLTVAMAETMDDIDTFDRALQAADLAPDRLFASAVRRIGALVSSG
jgi:rSAM/selenodomain-associated transferase 1